MNDLINKCLENFECQSVLQTFDKHQTLNNEQTAKRMHSHDKAIFNTNEQKKK